MDKVLSFLIEGKQLYSEFVLVEYSDTPLFFLCKDNDEFYLALCTDFYELNYVVTHLSSTETYNLLHGTITMRDAIVQQKSYWSIISGSTPEEDTVTLCDIATINYDILPDEGAYYNALTLAAKEYVSYFDNQYFSNLCVSGKDMSFVAENTKDAMELVPIDGTVELHINDSITVRSYIELAEYQLKVSSSNSKKTYECTCSHPYVLTSESKIIEHHLSTGTLSNLKYHSENQWATEYTDPTAA